MNTRRGKQTLTEEQKAKLLKAADEARERVSKRNAISRLAPASWLDVLESARRSIECLEHRALTEERYDIAKVLLQADIKLLKAIIAERSASN